MSARHLVLLSALLLPALFARTAQAQETFGSGDVDDTAAAAPAPEPASAAPANDWWRKKEPAPPPPHAPNPVALRLDGAYAPRRLFALGVTGADLGLAIGIQTSQHVAWWLTARATLGSTENGLHVWSGRLGPEVEAVFDPIRFGIGASPLMMGVDRAARDQTLHSYGLEGRAFVRFDCWRTDDVALFLRAAIDGAVEMKSGSAFWGPGIGVGVELGVHGKRRPEW